MQEQGLIPYFVRGNALYAGRLTRMSCPEKLGYKIAPAYRQASHDLYNSHFDKCSSI